MTVRVITGPVRYVGTSLDSKPHQNTSPQEGFGPPAEASTFLELDTGRLYGWQRDQWKLIDTSNAMLVEVARLITEVLSELRKVRFAVETEINAELQDPGE